MCTAKRICLACLLELDLFKKIVLIVMYCEICSTCCGGTLGLWIPWQGNPQYKGRQERVRRAIDHTMLPPACSLAGDTPLPMRRIRSGSIRTGPDRRPSALRSTGSTKRPRSRSVDPMRSTDCRAIAPSQADPERSRRALRCTVDFSTCDDSHGGSEVVS